SRPVPGRIPLSPGHSSLPEAGPKSARSISQTHTNQMVRRGRIERLGCGIGWRMKPCGCVLSVVVDPYRHIATRMGSTRMVNDRDSLSGHRPDNYNKGIQDPPGGAP